MTIHAHTHTGTLKTSDTHTSLMTGAIGHMPTMLEEGEINEGKEIKQDLGMRWGCACHYCPAVRWKDVNEA